ncbi:Down syndrome critical region protein 3-like protein, partial [Leptotrombidium deliense]
MSAQLDIRLKRVTKIYSEGDDLTGLIVFDCKTESRHEGITLSVEGIVNMQLSSKNVGIFEAFYNSAKPVPLITYSVEIAKSGKLPIGKTEIAFELPLRTKNNKVLFQTYHGVFITVQYMLKCEVKRSMLNKDLQKVVEFIVEYKPQDTTLEPKPVNFVISPESLQNVKDKSKVPSFRVSGQLESTVCRLSEPLSGEICVENCDAPIRSIELQLVRVETCGCAEGYARDATEIQNIQIGEGDVCRGVPIPIYMVFPRLFTCPTLV